MVREVAAARWGRASDPTRPSVVDLHPAFSNLILAGMPRLAISSVARQLERVDLPLQGDVIRAGVAIQGLYFPLTGVLAEIVRMSDGTTVEVNLIGREGMAGLAALLGTESTPLDVVTIVPGAFLHLPADDLGDVLDRYPGVREWLDRYTQAVLTVRAFAVGCDRLHPVRARLARCLLKVHDRVDGDELRLTQDTLALMLGVARPTVTLNAVALHRDGLIEYQRGHIRILDRRGLERAACECYWAVRAEFERLLDWRIG